MQIISRAQQWPDRIAITSDGKDFRFGELLAQSAQIASFLLGEKEDLQQARIAFMVPPGFDYVAIQWGIWRAGGIAVPLSLHAPLPALEYVLEDTGATMLLYDRAFWKKLMPLKEKVALHRLPIEAVEEKELPDMSADRAAMILYTSGTTSRPKGVVSTHANLEAQISCLVKAWEWNMDDQIVCVLPLHHVHGIVNVVSCALWSGARVHFLPKFNPENLFGYMLGSDVTLFMAVPTIYFKLISYWESLPGRGKENISNRLKDFRLLVSGSAALPISVLEKWRKISGHTLLERYGMTEIGMAVSNSYQGERRPGHIGLPLPGVDLRLVDEQDQLVADGESGEIQVKGPSIFREYWQKPEATRESFTTDGWFRTGDIAVFNQGSYRILGRNSVDIIKSGGYKISALEIEEVLRTHPQIKDCGVVGLADDEWGEIVGMSVVGENGPLELAALNSWMKERLPSYQIPRRIIFQDDLPRNALGKVTKMVLKEMMKP